MPTLRFIHGNVVLPERIEQNATVTVVDGRIVAVDDESAGKNVLDAELIDLQGGFLVPGYVDLHVHGGAGADFMDGTPQAFATVLQAHLRHGTTSLLPTSTVARHEQIIRFLQLCREFKHQPAAGACVLGAHFYGPYFAEEARGCHPALPIRAPSSEEFRQYLEYADAIIRATVAPELPGAKDFAIACRQRGVMCNAGHSYATFAQMEAARQWGISHVDHLFCAMSDRARLRQRQTYPMRGGVLEATLYFDDLTTEVIADGKHLERELLLLAYKIKGPDRLALVTDCNRALDMPDGDYIFGPLDGGQPIVRRDDVGLMPDGTALASGVTGMDHAVRTFHRLTGVPLAQVIRMATLTPARIAGWADEIGSIEVGKRADLLVLDRELHVQQVFREGVCVHG